MVLSYPPDCRDLVRVGNDAPIRERHRVLEQRDQDVLARAGLDGPHSAILQPFARTDTEDLVLASVILILLWKVNSAFRNRLRLHRPQMHPVPYQSDLDHNLFRLLAPG